MSDRIIIGPYVTNTLVALTDEEQEQGLKGMGWPPPVMSFPFISAAVRKFWMQNTISPLDIIFCRANSIISIYRGKPLSLKLIGPSCATDLVVELPAGTVERYKIKIGQKVELKYSVKTISKKFETMLRHWG